MKILILATLLIAQQALAGELYPFKNPSQQQQFNHLLTELRCMVCQNQDIADSNAPFAKDVKMLVYTQISQGASSDEIKSYLTERYGDYILFNPPLKSATFILWFAPLILLIIGLVIFIRIIKDKNDKFK